MDLAVSAHQRRHRRRRPRRPASATLSARRRTTRPLSRLDRWYTTASDRHHAGRIAARRLVAFRASLCFQRENPVRRRYLPTDVDQQDGASRHPCHVATRHRLCGPRASSRARRQPRFCVPCRTASARASFAIPRPAAAQAVARRFRRCCWPDRSQRRRSGVASGSPCSWSRFVPFVEFSPATPPFHASLDAESLRRECENIGPTVSGRRRPSGHGRPGAKETAHVAFALAVRSGCAVSAPRTP